MLLRSINIFCANGNGGGQRHHTERLASYLVESHLSYTLCPQCAGRSCSSLLPLPFSRYPAGVVLVAVGWIVRS